MPDFSYTARGPSGQKHEGVVSAQDHAAAVSELGDRGLVPLQVRERTRRRGRGRVGTSALARFYRQLADLLRSGVPLLRALRLLANQSSNAKLAAAADDITQRVTEGATLAESLARHDQIFSDVQCAMVRAGEQGNFLEDVLERIADNQEHAARMRSQVIGALVYPMILLVVGLGVVVVALTVLVPKFEGFLANGNALPPSTQWLLSASATIRSDWPWLLAALVAAGIALFVFRLHPLLTTLGRTLFSRAIRGSRLSIRMVPSERRERPPQGRVEAALTLPSVRRLQSIHEASGRLSRTDQPALSRTGWPAPPFGWELVPWVLVVMVMCISMRVWA